MGKEVRVKDYRYSTIFDDKIKALIATAKFALHYSLVLIKGSDLAIAYERHYRCKILGAT